MSDEYRKTVDIGGSLAYIFVHWKAVLIAALVCAIAVGGYAYTQKKNAPVVSELSSEEQIEKARAKLPEPEALYVEQLFGQYQRYLKELNSWNSYLDRSMVLQLDPGDYVKQVIQYSVKANSPSAVLAFNKSLLGQDEYRRLAAAYGEGAEADSISELVVFEDVGSSRTQGSAQASNAAPASSVVIEDEGTNGEENSFQGVFSFSLLAQDEQKAAAMEAEMDKIIAEKVRALTAGENSSEVSKVSSVTTRNEAGYLLAMQQEETAFRTCVRERTPESIRRYDQACIHTRSCLNLLPYNYEQIGALIYESRIRGNQMIEEAQQESDRLLGSARTESETMLTKSKNDSEAMLASAKDKSMTMMNAAKTEAERLLYRARTESEEMRSSARTESEELRRSAREESDQLLSSADAEAKRRVSSVQGQIDAKLTDGKKKYIAVQEEMNEIVDLFNQMQRRFMQSYKEIHEITQSMPDSLDDINVDFDEEDNLDGEYADEEVRFHFAGRRDADDLLDEDEDAD